MSWDAQGWPTDIRRLATDYRTDSEDLEAAATEVGAICDQASTIAWKGKTQLAFVEKLGQLLLSQLDFGPGGIQACVAQSVYSGLQS